MSAGLPAMSTADHVPLMTFPKSKKPTRDSEWALKLYCLADSGAGTGFFGHLLLDRLLAGIVSLGHVIQVESLLPYGHRFGLFTERLVDVAKMFEDLDVLAIVALGRLQQVLLGLSIVLLFEEDPAEAVEVSGIVLIVVALNQALVLELLPLGLVQFERLADQPFGFVEFLIVVREHIAEVVVVGRAIRMGLDQLAELLDGLVGFAEVGVDAGHHVLAAL